VEDTGGTGGRPAGEPGLDLSRPGESFVETVRRVVRDPAEFFGRITDESRVWPPIVFTGVCSLVSAVFGIAVELAVPVDFGPLAGSMGGLPEGFSEQLGGAALAGLLIALVVLLPVFVLLGLYLGSLIYHGLIRLIVGRGNAGFWVTFKIYAYTSVVSLLSWLPVLGLLASLYGYYLVFVAVREGHSTSAARAAAVAAIPLAVFLGSLGLGVFSAASAAG